MKPKRLLLCITILVLCASAWLCAISEDKGGTVTMFNNTDIMKCVPGLYDVSAAMQRGLGNSKELNDEFFTLQAIYARSLWEWIDAAGVLKALDERLMASEKGFLPTNEPENVYQAHWSFGMHFLFLRNDLHIERLSESEIDELRTLPEDAGGKGARRAFVQRTLRMVITVYPGLGDADQACYEMSGLFAPNFAVVLGLATTPNYAPEGAYVDPQMEADKITTLDAWILSAQQGLSEALGVPVVILRY